MSEHLCLKWNNHSVAFLKGIKNIEIKEKYCDATIVCQGKYFPVHRFVLSTCSEYFEEIFDRIECPHPYVIFKDIDPREISLLLSYMYQGEVNVLQNNLPTFIKAAEALKIKGLAVPDDISSGKESKDEKSRKRGASSNDTTSYAKRRVGDFTHQRNSHTSHEPSVGGNQEYTRNSDNLSNSASHEIQNIEHIPIKQEPLPPELDSKADSEYSDSYSVQDSGSDNYTINDVGYMKSEPSENANLAAEGQDWSELDMEFNATQPFNTEATGRDDMAQESNWPEGNGKNPSRVALQSTGYPAPFDSNVPSKKFHHCTICSYKSYSKAHLRSHIMFKHSLERPYPCAICHKRFVEKVGLERHTRIHTGEKPFQCSLCVKRFRQKIQVQRHMAANHSEYK